MLCLNNCLVLLINVEDANFLLKLEYESLNLERSHFLNIYEIVCRNFNHHYKVFLAILYVNKRKKAGNIDDI